MQGGPHLLVHPRDAEERGIGADGYVRVYKDRGEFVVRAEPTDQVARGVTFSDTRVEVELI